MIRESSASGPSAARAASAPSPSGSPRDVIRLFMARLFFSHASRSPTISFAVIGAPCDRAIVAASSKAAATAVSMLSFKNFVLITSISERILPAFCSSSLLRTYDAPHNMDRAAGILDEFDMAFSLREHRLGFDLDVFLLALGCWDDAAGEEHTNSRANKREAEEHILDVAPGRSNADHEGRQYEDRPARARYVQLRRTHLATAQPRIMALLIVRDAGPNAISNEQNEKWHQPEELALLDLEGDAHSIGRAAHQVSVHRQQIG